MASWPPAGEPIAHGEPGSSGRASSALFLPLRAVVPIGCTGGRYTTSKPIEAIASKRLAAVRSVPDTDLRRPSGSTLAPSDRGKNSYQDPNSDRCLSTMSGYHSDLVV